MRATREVTSFEGVVLHRRAVGESDLIVDLLGVGCGRVSLLARGARASRKRFPGKLEMGAAIRAYVIARGALWHLQDADLLDARVGLRAEWDRWARAAVMLDCVRALAAPGEANDAMWRALSDGLDQLARGELAAAVAFYPRLLDAAGLAPDLSACGTCQRVGVALVARGPNDSWCCEACASGGRRVPAAVIEVLAGAPCREAPIADAVQTLVVELVEGAIGRSLAARVAMPER